MDQPFPASAGQVMATPLTTISPERANVQKTPLHRLSSFHDTAIIPLSPSGTSLLSSGNLPDRVSRHHVRAGSEVLDKVAKFDGLSRETAERRKKDDAALKRALMGREEAEDEVRLLKEESKRQRGELEEERRKTARVALRLEDITDNLHASKEEISHLREELQRTKEVQSHSQNLYEKEVRRAKKDAFKYSSAYVKLQEELKATRLSLRVMESDLESQKQKVDKHAQEAFSAEYQLVGAQEELTKMAEKLKVIEEERESLKMHLKEEEVARIAAEGRIALPMAKGGDDFNASPVKQKAPELPAQPLPVSTPSNGDIFETEEYLELAQQLDLEKILRLEAEEAVEFLKMECQFETCSCRVTERSGQSYKHDTTTQIDRFQQSMRQSVQLSKAPDNDEDHTLTRRQLFHPPAPVEDTDVSSTSNLAFNESTGTFRVAPTPSRTSKKPTTYLRQRSPDEPSSILPDETSLLSLLSAPVLTHPHAHAPSHPSPHHYHPSTHLEQDKDDAPPPVPPLPSQPYQYQQRSYTTTVPLAGEHTSYTGPSSSSTSDPSPQRTMTRQEAIEQIRQRRGRARSMAAAAAGGSSAMTAAAATPKKQNVGGSGARRDISAPAVRSVGRVGSREGR